MTTEALARWVASHGFTAVADTKRGCVQVVIPTTRDGVPSGEDGEIIYSAFTGGGSGAEIGSYDSIECGECGGIVWNEVPPEDAP